MAAPLFRHGVAAGDPAADGLVLWTRVTTPSPEPVPLRWEVAGDAGFDAPVAEGRAVATADTDHTVHVPVAGLAPSTRYRYRFVPPEAPPSPVGSATTLPAPGDERPLRLAVVCCGSWPSGWFQAYRRVAERDVDVVVHLGDAIYDAVKDGPRVRAHDPDAAPVTLEQYRRRHAQYREDPDLQALHARHAVIGVWDDHDIVSDTWRDGAADHDDERDGPWEPRRDAAVRAFREWQPSLPPDPADPVRAWRRLPLGDLADLVVLDTRLAGRERPAAEGGRPVVAPVRGDRELLGEAQWAWLGAELRSSSARWRLLANQVMLAPLPALRLPGRGLLVNTGQWDGYPAERQRLLDLLDDPAVGPAAVLTGDIHATWAAELRRRSGRRGAAIAAELVAPAVSSPSFATSVLPPLPGAARVLARLLRLQHRHLRVADLEHHGYLLLEVHPERLLAEWWYVDPVTRRHDRERRGPRVEIRPAEDHVRLDLR